MDMQNALNSAKWERIMKALDRMGIPTYVQKVIASFFTAGILRYDPDDGPMEYRVSRERPQGSVLAPLLWINMYNGLLNLKISRMVTPVAFAECCFRNSR